MLITLLNGRLPTSRLMARPHFWSGGLYVRGATEVLGAAPKVSASGANLYSVTRSSRGVAAQTARPSYLQVFHTLLRCLYDGAVGMRSHGYPGETGGRHLGRNRRLDVLGTYAAGSNCKRDPTGTVASQANPNVVLAHQEKPVFLGDYIRRYSKCYQPA